MVAFPWTPENMHCMLSFFDLALLKSWQHKFFADEDRKAFNVFASY